DFAFRDPFADVGKLELELRHDDLASSSRAARMNPVRIAPLRAEPGGCGATAAYTPSRASTGTACRIRSRGWAVPPDGRRPVRPPGSRVQPLIRPSLASRPSRSDYRYGVRCRVS